VAFTCLSLYIFQADVLILSLFYYTHYMYVQVCLCKEPVLTEWQYWYKSGKKMQERKGDYEAGKTRISLAAAKKNKR
jgi:hypothetical protein